MLEIACQVLVCIFMIAVAFLSDFFYHESDQLGTTIISHAPTNIDIGITADQDGFRYQASQAEYMPQPPSNTALILSQKITNYQQLQHCQTRNKCDKTCVNFRKSKTYPTWCTKLKLMENTKFSNIDSLELSIRSIYLQDTAKELQVDPFMTHKVSISQLLSRLKDKKKDSDIQTIGIRYYFSCVQSIFMWYNCDKELIVSRFVKNIF